MISKRNSKALVAAILGGLALTSAANPAAAGRAAYCDAYARDVADSRAGVGDVLAGTIGGALGGALIGSIIDNGEGAGKGALIGGVAGTAIGAAATDAKRQKAYRRAFNNCMSRSSRAAEPIRYASGSNLRPGSKAWYRYCAARYRSFNPETGTYTAYSGKTYPCR